jgi:hypothetical protein
VAADIPNPQQRSRGYVGPTGPRWWSGTAGAYSAAPYITDDGFTGKTWGGHWHAELGATVYTCQAYGKHAAPGLVRRHHRWRQVIETANAILAAALHLAFPRAKRPWGLITRLTAKCCAFNVGIWVNRFLGRPDLAIDTLFPA